MEYPILPKDVSYILDTLNHHGYEAYIVGGCVRDSLLGQTPKDWDITTSAKPEETKALFPHTFDTGIQHGTITVVLHKENYEVTTYRIDGAYEDCRHPKGVSFTTQLKEDLLRRDFTMNAIAYHPKEGYKDFFHGTKDIQEKIIRGVGTPSLRFQEDALRMLRCLRFSAQLGFSIESTTYTALIENKSLLQHISEERIRIELEKLFLSSHVSYIPVLWESGLSEIINPCLSQYLQQQSTSLLEELYVCPKDPILCWSLVLQNHTVNEAHQFFKSLKFDNHTALTVSKYLKYIHIPLTPCPYDLRKKAGLLGISALTDLFTLQTILYPSKELELAKKCFDNILKNKDCLNLKQLEIDGSSLIALGIPKGKEIGTILGYLLDLVYESPQKNQNELLITLAKEWKNNL